MKTLANHFLLLSHYKDCLLIGLFSLIMITIASGQVSFGIKAGPSFSYMNFDETDLLTSLHAGAFAKIELSKALFLQPEILVSGKGVILPDFAIGPESMSFKMYYLSLPLMLGVNINDRLALKAGPEANFLLAAETTIFGNSSDNKDGFSSNEISLNGGLAYMFFNQLGMELRYSHGISTALDIHFTDVNGQSLGNTEDRKNRSFQVSIFYLIRAAEKVDGQ